MTGEDQEEREQDQHEHHRNDPPELLGPEESQELAEDPEAVLHFSEQRHGRGSVLFAGS